MTPLGARHESFGTASSRRGLQQANRVLGRVAGEDDVDGFRVVKQPLGEVVGVSDGLALSIDREEQGDLVEPKEDSSIEGKPREPLHGRLAATGGPRR
jgi:hypothetical protein